MTMSSKQLPLDSATFQDWKKAATRSAPDGDLDLLNWVTPDGITVKPLYTAEDVQALPHTHTFPGFAPFVRGQIGRAHV